MIHRNFTANCVFRIILLALTMLVFIYLLLASSVRATVVLCGLAIIYQAYSLIRYVHKTNRDLTRFLRSIEYSDFSQTFSSELKGSSFDELSKAFTLVLNRFREISLEKEEHYRYLQTVVQHVGVGIIAYRKNGEVELFNAAAKKMLDLPALKNIGRLESVCPPLAARLRSIEPGQRELITVSIHDELLQLSIYATELRQRRQALTLVSLQNISNELNQKEMDAWQNLIRVLTHEIKNSLTPIASLASSVEELVLPVEPPEGAALSKKESGLEAKPISASESGLEVESAPEAESSPETESVSEAKSRDIRDALHTIQKRSHGLLQFVDTYRNLTHIPKPDYRVFAVRELFGRMERMARPHIEGKTVSLATSIEPESLTLTADEQLIEQVLINIILNAIQALEGRAGGRIGVEARIEERGRAIIRIIDNGPGIVPEALEKVFIPFYSTKQGGSGIGLSLSRQIMRMHRGDLLVQSEPDVSTVFTMRF
ncbi:MAG: ATP-binding protein [Candidatus Krumholzibacteriota bacterium]|nr:ATP-binding protein [Candidatus Krumholzibacteriota bacterium]